MCDAAEFKLGLALDQATATNELYSSTGSSSSHNNGMEGEVTSSSAWFSVFGPKSTIVILILKRVFRQKILTECVCNLKNTIGSS